MKHACIIANRDKDIDLTVSRWIVEKFKEYQVDCIISEAEMNADGKCCYTNPDSLPDNLDFILTIGGDGTLIEAAYDLRHLNIPLIGVNMGTLGYLAEIDTHSLEQAVRALAEGNYMEEDRMMLSGKIFRNGEMIAKGVSLNDAVISRVGHTHVIDFDVFVDKQFLTRYKADGIILSTPTGSTAYNLSAGGPLIVPNASLFVMTPICAHTLNSRSVVLPDYSVINIVIKGKQNSRYSTCAINFDGNTQVDLTEGDIIEIYKSSVVTRLLKLSNTSFFEVLRNKMN